MMKTMYLILLIAMCSVLWLAITAYIFTIVPTIFDFIDEYRERKFEKRKRKSRTPEPLCDISFEATMSEDKYGLFGLQGAPDLTKFIPPRTKVRVYIRKLDE